MRGLDPRIHADAPLLIAASARKPASAWIAGSSPAMKLVVGHRTTTLPCARSQEKWPGENPAISVFRCARDRIPCRSLARDLVVDALDVPVHAQDLAGIEMVAALALHRLAVLILDRALERVEFAGPDRLFRVLRHLLHIVRHVGVGRHHDHAGVEAAPSVL